MIKTFQNVKQIVIFIEKISISFFMIQKNFAPSLEKPNHREIIRFLFIITLIVIRVKIGIF